MITFALALLALIVAAVSVAYAVTRAETRRLASALQENRAKSAGLDKELAELRRTHAQIVQDRTFLAHFVREFPHLTRELHGAIPRRQIPNVLLKAVMRCLEPKQALVAVRRSDAESAPGRGNRMIVAAAAPRTPEVVGTEFAIGAGELGYVAEVQRDMSRRDFELETAVTRRRLRQENLPGLDVDLAAPLVFGQESLGLIALWGSRWTTDELRPALRLLAQTGAQALQNAVAYSQMKNTADLDGLTGVFNKRQMTQMLGELLYAAEQDGSHLSIFLFDIDNFKNYNDVNGHVAGDALLQLIARLVATDIRKEDLFGRFGGEEFLLILRQTPLAQALMVADKIRSSIASHPFPFAERQPLGVLSVRRRSRRISRRRARQPRAAARRRTRRSTPRSARVATASSPRRACT